jgi:peptidoglycan/LPS O-acetylase OafA/YrhL
MAPAGGIGEDGGGVRRRPAQLPALTSIRFLAALHVALYHMVRPFGLWGPLTGMVAAGYTGVSFFFLLSGYILTYSHANEEHRIENGAAFRWRFYFARFARIYPAYLMTLLAAGWVLRTQFQVRSHALAFVADLLMVQTWSLRMVSFFNVPAWSVSSEVFFYAVFPFVVFGLRPSNRWRALLNVAMFWALALVMPMICLLYAPQGAWHEGGGLFAFWVRRFPVFALPEFLAGISLGWLYVCFRPSARAALWLSVMGATGTMAALYFADRLPALLLHNGLLLPLYGMVLVGLSESTWLSRALAVRPLLVLGEASYALYLTHFLLNDWMERALKIGSALGALPLKLAVALVVALLLHFAVERPCRSWLLRWWRKL